MVNQLTHQLYWGLSSKLLYSRHVNIINKNQCLWVALCAKHLLSLLDQLRLDVDLGAVAGGLGTEIENDGSQLHILFVLVNELLDD